MYNSLIQNYRNNWATYSRQSGPKIVLSEINQFLYAIRYHLSAIHVSNNSSFEFGIDCSHVNFCLLNV